MTWFEERRLFHIFYSVRYYTKGIPTPLFPKYFEKKLMAFFSLKHITTTPFDPSHFKLQFKGDILAKSHAQK